MKDLEALFNPYEQQQIETEKRWKKKLDEFKAMSTDEKLIYLFSYISTVSSQVDRLDQENMMHRPMTI